MKVNTLRYARDDLDCESDTGGNAKYGTQLSGLGTVAGIGTEAGDGMKGAFRPLAIAT